MNVKVTIYLCFIGAAICNMVLTSVLLVMRRDGKKDANWLLAALLIFLAASFFTDIFFATGFYNRYPRCLGYDSFLTLSLGPLLYYYIRQQTRPDQRLEAVDSLHILSLIVYAFLLKDFFFSDDATKRALTADVKSITNYSLANNFVVGQLLIYGLACYRMLARHNRIIEDVLSSPENKRLTWLRHLLAAAALLFVVWVIINNFTVNESLLGLTLLIFSYWVAYKALGQGLVFDENSTEAVLPIFREEEPEQRYRNSNLTLAAIETIGAKLVRFMDESKPYLDPALSLTSLSLQLNVNPNHLSQVLNEGFKLNFYNFINRYRVEESKRLLINPTLAHYSIMAIGGEAGFNSKSTFNKVFREITGVSPSEYVKQHQQLG
ncbi:MAG TPA: helix-turn-helix domain-containing protein [Pedobacter sp.]|jgi:AraC-like DNA-binding protein